MTTKTRILDTAERLFAEQGYDATSLRLVTREADVNLAAVHYHFGSKLDLLKAVFERRVGRINEDRLAQLEAVEAASGQATLEDVLEAFFGPPLRYAAPQEEGWHHFMVLVGRLNSTGGEAFNAVKDVFRVVRERFFPAIKKAVPGLPPEELAWRIHFLIGSMSALIADPTRIEAFSMGLCRGDNPEESLRQLVAFAAGGLRAPAPSPSLDRPANG
jgi:AcrR family transcriptional regulator